MQTKNYGSWQKNVSGGEYGRPGLEYEQGFQVMINDFTILRAPDKLIATSGE
jgi:hypothetical protein